MYHSMVSTSKDPPIGFVFRRGCAFSQGNYLLKHALLPNSTEANPLLFDNVVLAAADTNNANHRDFVDKIRYNQR